MDILREGNCELGGHDRKDDWWAKTRIREKLATGDGRQAEGDGVGDDGQGPFLR